MAMQTGFFWFKRGHRRCFSNCSTGSSKSIQELIGSQNGCFGCGPSNSNGLQLQSFWQGHPLGQKTDPHAVAYFKALPYMSGGAPHVLNGGIIATVVDCHAVMTAIAGLYQAKGNSFDLAENMAVASKPVWAVTAQLNVQYAAITELSHRLRIEGVLRSIERAKVWVDVRIFDDEVLNSKPSVMAEVLAINVEGESNPLA